MDRFNSHEDVEWAKGSFDDGAWARISGIPIDGHPSTDTIGQFAVRSWRAGWADADMELQALHEASPDLLEALKEAQAVLAVFWMGDHAGRPLADKIQAAIDKAERKAHEARQ